MRGSVVVDRGSLFLMMAGGGPGSRLFIFLGGFFSTSDRVPLLGAGISVSSFATEAPRFLFAEDLAAVIFYREKLWDKSIFLKVV
jgi:hypothetical protein